MANLQWLQRGEGRPSARLFVKDLTKKRWPAKTCSCADYNGKKNGDLQPGCLADRLLTGLGQPEINACLALK